MKRAGRRLLRAAALGILAVLVLALVLGIWVARGRVLENLLESTLARDLGVRVEVARVSFVAPFGARVEELAVYSPLDPTHPCVRVPELYLRFGGTGPAGLASAEVHGAEILATEDGARLDLLEILRHHEPRQVVPRVRVSDARVRLQGHGPICSFVGRALEGTSWSFEVPALDLVAGPAPGQLAFQGRGGLQGLAPLALSGELRPGGTEVTVETLPDQPLDPGGPVLRERLAAPARRWLEDNNVQGPVSARAHWDGRSLGLTAELLGVALDPALFSCHVENVRGRVELSDGTLRLEGLQGDHEGVGLQLEGLVNDVFREPQLDVHLSTEPFLAAGAVETALRRLPGGEAFLEAFHPGGLLRAECHWTRAANGQSTFQHRVELQDASLRFDGFEDPSLGRRRGFPLPVQKIRGVASVGPESFELRDGTGLTESGGRVEGDVVSQGLGKNQHVVVDAVARSVPLDEQFESACVAAFGDPARRWIHEIGLSGAVDLTLHYARQPGTEDEFRVTLQPRGTQALPERFPVPLRLEGGSVLLGGGRLVVQDVRGETGGEGPPVRFQLQGQLEGNDPGRPFDLALALEGMPVPTARELQHAALPELTGLLDALDDDGALDLQLHWWRAQAGSAVHWEGSVRMAGVDWTPAGFPLTLRALHGALRFHGEEGGDWQAEISPEEPLQAGVAAGSVTLQGTFSRDRATLDVAGERLYVTTRDRDRSDVLRLAAVFRPELMEFLAGLQATGWVRIQAHLGRDAAGPWELRQLDLAPDFPARIPAAPTDTPPPEASSPAPTGGVTLRLAAFSKALVWGDGMIRGVPKDGVAEFENLRASLGEATLSVPRGTLRRGPEQLDVVLSGTFDTVSAEDLIDPMLTPGARNLLRRWNLRGVSHADVQEVRVSLPHNEPFPSQVHVVAKLELRHTELHVGGGLQDLAGVLNAQLDYERPPGSSEPRLKIVGEISGASFFLGPFPVSNVSAKLLVSDGVMSLRDIDADLAGGRFNAANNRLRIPLTGGEPFEGNVHLEGAQLDRLLGEHDPRTRDWKGQLDVDLRLGGEGTQLSQFRADGTVRVHDGQLWRIPVFDKVFELGLSRVVGVKQPPKFESGSVRVEMFRGILWLTDLDLVGSSLRLQGDAVVSPGGVDAHLFPEVAVDVPFVDFPLLGNIVQAFARGVERRAFSFRFGGPWQDLQVRWDPISTRPGSPLGESLDRPRTSEPPPVVSLPRF